MVAPQGQLRKAIGTEVPPMLPALADDFMEAGRKFDASGFCAFYSFCCSQPFCHADCCVGDCGVGFAWSNRARNSTRPFHDPICARKCPKKLWGGPQFLRTNQIITLVWLAAFAIIIVADLVLLYLPDVPHKVSVLMTIGALYGAFKFTTATQTGQKQKPPDS